MKRTLAFAAVVMLTLPAGMCVTTRFVTVPCVSKEQYDGLKDSEPQRVKDRLTGKADEDIRTIAGSNVRLRAWGGGLLGIIGGCVDPKG